MTSETPQEPTEAAPEPQAPAAPPPADTPPDGGDDEGGGNGGGSKKLALIAILLALIALLGVGYTGWSGSRQADGVGQRTTQLASEIDSIPARVQRSLQGELGTMKEKTSTLHQEIGSVRSKVDRVMQELSALTTADRTDWMLAEVEYLLRLASQRVLMEDDLVSAEVILQAADRVLLELNDSRLHKVRAALAQDLAAVRAAGALDVEGIFLRLRASAEQVDMLPLLVPSSELGSARASLIAAGEQPVEGGASGEEAVRNLLQRAWLQIRELVVVRHRSDAVRPLLPPDQEYYLRQNLRMLIEQAQLGLLRGSNAVYQESLKAAQEWITAYFPADDESVQGLLRSLREAARFDVSPQRPDVARGLRALQQRQSERHWRTPSNGQAPS